MMNTSALFETDNAARHMTALCQHFGRKVDAGCDAHKGWVRFSFGQCELTADASHLKFCASADDQTQLDRVVEVVTSHLERFAFRENPELMWTKTTEGSQHP